MKPPDTLGKLEVANKCHPLARGSRSLYGYHFMYGYASSCEQDIHKVLGQLRSFYFVL